MKKKNTILYIGLTLLFIGTLLPAIRIARDNINFIKENGTLTLILIAISFILIYFKKENFNILPASISIYTIINFIIENKNRLKEINEIYNCYAKFQYGLIVMLIADIIIISTILISMINKEKIIKIFKKIKNTLKQTIQTTKKIFIQIKITLKKTYKTTKEIIKKLKLKEHILTIKTKIISLSAKLKQAIIKKQETTKDGKISFHKLTVKCDNNNKKHKLSIKEKLELLKIKIQIKRIKRKHLSLSKYHDNKETKRTTQKNHKMPIIDIRKWTRSDVCCINCGATVSTNSEYCFLCDCKIKLENKDTLKQA